MRRQISGISHRIAGGEVLKGCKLEPQEVMVCAECFKLRLLRAYGYPSRGGLDYSNGERGSRGRLEYEII